MTSYEIPESMFITFPERDLPGDWKIMPSPQSTKDFGSYYLKNPNVLGLKVPSTVVPQEFNYLINPAYAKRSEIRVIDAQDFIFDIRVKA